jgi:mRNA-degrading endonuclease toxin of MazEF toxin-antitoxin module
MVGIGHAAADVGPRRGDVYVVALPDVGGHVMKGPHPVVVVRSDQLSGSTTVNIVPMTSAPRSAVLRPPYLVEITGRESGLPRDGFAKCDQVLTLPVDLFRTRAGRLSPAVIDRVDASLRFVLGL